MPEPLRGHPTGSRLPMSAPPSRASVPART
jgi:hypothetical protein